MYDRATEVCTTARAGHPGPAVVHPDGTVTSPERDPVPAQKCVRGDQGAVYDPQLRRPGGKPARSRQAAEVAGPDIGLQQTQQTHSPTSFVLVKCLFGRSTGSDAGRIDVAATLVRAITFGTSFEVRPERTS
ncbi:serine/threonine-protein phosphatase [Streptomyces sp. NBC_01445]|nr:serine/threonine-protein phosphatase [Streptomyces sp. NBC_01445]